MRIAARSGAQREHPLPQRRTAVDVKGILRGKKSDVNLQAEDILFIPGSTGKKAALRGIEVACAAQKGEVRDLPSSGPTEARAQRVRIFHQTLKFLLACRRT
jgi:hypothetical protein